MSGGSPPRAISRWRALPHLGRRLGSRLSLRPHSRGRRAVRLLALGAAVLVGVVGCAPEPLAGWVPPQAAGAGGVALAAEAAAGPEAPGGAAAGDTADPLAVAQPSGIAPDAAALGLVGGRLRNDALPLAARYVQLPGVPAFNERVDRLLWEAIGATGQPYVPQVHPVEAGLAERGCVAGSASWAAAEVLTRPETAPAGGAGTAITCEVAGAFGNVLIITMRTVIGSPEAVNADTSLTLTVDVSTGAVTEGVQEWSDAAPAELWRATVGLLRQQAGGLSTAELAEPDAGQLQLAVAALAQATHSAGGGLLVTMPAGVAAPELQGLGIEATTEPLALTVNAATALTWASEQRRALLAAADQPFAGLPAAPSSAPVDCALVPCIALTYDDGPSAFTPELLDTLASRHANATFYMIGGYAEGSRDLVARAAAEGNEIGSHTMNHKTLTKIPIEEARAQVRDAAAALAAASGQSVATYRPPYGEINAAAQAAIDMPAVLWSIDTNDWRKPGQQALYERTVPPARPGQIVLFHDTHADTVQAAGAIIDGLRNRGFEPVTVSELFGGAVPNRVVRSG